ncbi:MAG TPA: hypothetical protein VFA02_13100, partial [Pseudacidobacterium sp.]|nr:hypothetical protein [Pseudacidobacterium sp.]
MKMCPFMMRVNHLWYGRKLYCIYPTSTDISVHLESILFKTRETVAERKQRVPVRELEKLAAEHTPRRFANVLSRRAQDGPAIIAELKKASPSKGLIRSEFDVRALASELEQAGAAALSV